MTDELILESDDGKKPSATAEIRLRSKSPVERLYGYFIQQYERAWGIPLILCVARDRAILKRFCDQLGEIETRTLIDEFFRAVRPVAKGGDPVVSKSRWSNLMDLSYHAQYLLLKRSRGNQLADRTASNLAEIRKAMGKS